MPHTLDVNSALLAAVWANHLAVGFHVCSSLLAWQQYGQIVHLENGRAEVEHFAVWTKGSL